MIIPEYFQILAKHHTFDGVVPDTFFYDMRSKLLKKNDKLGISKTTFDEKLNMFKLRPTIVTCLEKGDVTEPSIRAY